DETDGAVAGIDAFVELLREAHGSLGAEAELAGRLLLQRRSRERRCGIAAALLAIDLQHLEIAVRGIPPRALDRMRLAGVLERELLDLLSLVFDQLERELLRGVLARSLDGPVLARLEGGNFFFALADEPQRRALHATGGQSAPHFLP